MGEDDTTYDLELEDLTPEDFILLVGAVGTLQIQCIGGGNMEHAHQAGEMVQDLLLENRDLTREALLHTEGTDYLHVANIPDDDLDELGLEVVEGNVRDAEAEEIEVE